MGRAATAAFVISFVLILVIDLFLGILLRHYLLCHLAGRREAVFLTMVTTAHDPTPRAPILDIRDLHVQFGTQPVLRSIDLRVPPGQTLAIIGESGCGKTVLLKTMIGLIRPARGVYGSTTRTWPP